MNTSLIRLAILALGMISLAPATLRAGLCRPISWRQESDDKRHVLVMVSPLRIEEDTAYGTHKQAEIDEIRSRYRVSGLYLNDGSQNLLWTIPYFDPSFDIFIAPDVKHLVVFHNAHVGQYWMKVWFFAGGKEIASHDLDKLVPMTLVNRTIYRDGPYCHHSRLDEAGVLFSLRTNYEIELQFDVASGEIVRRQTPWPTRFAIFLAAIVPPTAMLVFALVLRVYWRRTVPSISVRPV